MAEIHNKKPLIFFEQAGNYIKAARKRREFIERSTSEARENIKNDLIFDIEPRAKREKF